MRSMIYVTPLLIWICLQTITAIPPPQKLGIINITRPGFTNFYINNAAANPMDKYTLLVANFDPIPFTEDNVFAIEDIGRKIGNLPDIVPTLLTKDITWPREPSQVPYQVFDLAAVCQPSGFLVPTKTDGAIKILDVSDLKNVVTHDITSPLIPGTEWFFHRVLWKDMNGDGRMDAVTNRARKPIGENASSEFVWYEHPDFLPLQSTWEAHVINQNIGDTFLSRINLVANGVTYDVIFTVGYFSEKLAVHWSDHGEGKWDDNSMIKTRIIDEGCRFFEVKIIDMNKDGRLDLMVICNAVTNGTAVVYEIPDDFRTGKYAKHVIKSGFYTLSENQGAGTPGGFAAFYPDLRDTSGKPLLAMTGDDSGQAFILEPESQDVNNWDYKLITLQDNGDGNIMGNPSAADVDGDGYSDLFFPAFYDNMMHVFSYKP